MSGVRSYLRSYLRAWLPLWFAAFNLGMLIGGLWLREPVVWLAGATMIPWLVVLARDRENLGPWVFARRRRQRRDRQP